MSLLNSLNTCEDTLMLCKQCRSERPPVKQRLICKDCINKNARESEEKKLMELARKHDFEEIFGEILSRRLV